MCDYPNCVRGWVPAQEPVGAFLKDVKGVRVPCPRCAIPVVTDYVEMTEKNWQLAMIPAAGVMNRAATLKMIEDVHKKNDAEAVHAVDDWSNIGS